MLQISWGVWAPTSSFICSSPCPSWPDFTTLDLLFTFPYFRPSTPFATCTLLLLLHLLYSNPCKSASFVETNSGYLDTTRIKALPTCLPTVQAHHHSSTCTTTRTLVAPLRTRKIPTVFTKPRHTTTESQANDRCKFAYLSTQSAKLECDMVLLPRCKFTDPFLP